MPDYQLPIPGIAESDLPRSAEQIAAEDAPIECACCSAEVCRAEAIDLDGELHCPDCVHSCEECGHSSTHADDFATAYTRGDVSIHSHRQRTQVLCNHCRWDCADCGNTFAEGAEDGRNASDERICARCAESYTTCESCDSTVHTDYSCYHESSERTLCEDCYRRACEDDEEESPRGRSTRIIHNHWHKPPARFFDSRATVEGFSSPLPGIPYFGVEFEVDSKTELDNVSAVQSAGLHPNPFYHCEEDGSLTYGFEIVSKAASWQHWQSVDLSWMDSLKRAGYRAYDTSTCGQHIHVSRSFFTEDEVFALLSFVKRNSKVMERLSRRIRFDYCMFNRISEADTKRLIAKAKTIGADNRYEAINLENEKTIEFRLFRGTLCPKGFRRNLSLVVALSHFVKFANFGRRDWLTAEFFAKWIRTRGRKVLGAEDARVLAEWVESAIVGTVAADTAA